MYLAKHSFAQGYCTMHMSKQRPEGDKKAKPLNIISNIVLLTSETLPENKKNKSLTFWNKCYFQTLLPVSEYNPNCYSSKSLCIQNNCALGGVTDLITGQKKMNNGLEDLVARKERSLHKRSIVGFKDQSPALEKLPLAKLWKTNKPKREK